jgi:GNAT superfamily N-acetyltransferase
MNYIIEQPKKEEINQLVSLCAAHALFEKCEYDSKEKHERLLKDIFANDPKLQCRVAVVDETYVGYITWMKQYSTWNAAEYLYMDCLFLDDEYRSNGIGVNLVVEMKKFGKENNIYEIQWQTPDFNKRAIKIYSRIGATSLSKERFFLEIN